MITLDGSTSQPDPIILCEIHLYENFTIQQAQEAILKIAETLNKMTGLALASGKLSAGNPVTQHTLTGAASCEQAAQMIQQQMNAGSNIVAPQFGVGPRRMQ